MIGVDPSRLKKPARKKIIDSSLCLSLVGYINITAVLFGKVTDIHTEFVGIG